MILFKNFELDINIQVSIITKYSGTKGLILWSIQVGLRKEIEMNETNKEKVSSIQYIYVLFWLIQLLHHHALKVKKKFWKLNSMYCSLGPFFFLWTVTDFSREIVNSMNEINSKLNFRSSTNWSTHTTAHQDTFLVLTGL